MAKQVLSQRDLKTQSAISVPAAGFVAIGAKADGIYSRTESGVEKRLLNTDDVVGGGATTAAQISTIALGSTTFKNLQQIHDLTRSAGHLDGGNIVNGGGQTVNVSAGKGFIRGSSDDTSTLFPFEWLGINGASIPLNSLSYVIVDYNAGTPIVSIVASNTTDYRMSFVLGYVVNEGGILYINDVPHSSGRGVGRLSRMDFEISGRSRANALGGLIISQSGVKRIAVTAAVTWYRGIRETFNSFDSNATDNFDRYYRNGSGGWTREATQIAVPEGQFDNGSGTLATIGNRNFGNYWFYLGPAGNIVMVYGRENINTLAAVLSANPPADLPLRLQVGALLIGRAVVTLVSGVASIDQVQSAFNVAFSGSAVTSHNSLSGLQGGILAEYFHLSAAELAIVQATSGTNTGNNAVNTLYSGLAASKQDTLVSATNIKTINSVSILGSGNIVLAPIDSPVFTTSITTPLILGGASVSGDVTISSTSNATKGRIIFGASAAYNETLKRFGIGTLVPDCTVHASSTSEAIYLRLQGVSDGDNYAALELWNSTGTKKWQFAHKSFPGDEGDFGFYHWTGVSWINPLRIRTNTGNIGIGVSLPTAAMHFKAGTASVGTAPIKLTTGVLMTTSEQGAIEMAAGHVYFTAVNGGPRYQLDQQAGGASPLTTKGDLYGFSTVDARLAVGTNGQVLSADSTQATGLRWVSAVGGGNVTTDTLSLNNQIGVWTSGVNIEGDVNFLWDALTQTQTIAGANPSILMGGITNEPASPAANFLTIYAKSVAGKMVPKIKGPSGLDTPLQNAFWQNNIVMWNPTNATAGVWLGTVGATTGTYARGLPTTTTVYTSVTRSRYSNVVNTANQILGARNTELMYTRGSIALQGGFFFYARAGMDVWTNGGRLFVGMHTATTVVSADPSALNNTVGFCIDAGDLGAISFLTRGTAATKAATGLTMASAKGFDFYMFCPPNSTTVSWRIVEINTGAETSGVATLNLPAATTLLTAGVLASNAAVAVVTSIQLGINRIYIETDY